MPSDGPVGRAVAITVVLVLVLLAGCTGVSVPTGEPSTHAAETTGNPSEVAGTIEARVVDSSPDDAEPVELDELSDDKYVAVVERVVDEYRANESQFSASVTYTNGEYDSVIDQYEAITSDDSYAYVEHENETVRIEVLVYE
ncbi:hypothetical protein [Halobaculum litoreum]|uniref:Uncharacterized protein n=1 Tax=Halobaculum litoreum TaxID=3031998 RepID=A0ABD5XM73_9EURY|nr:hypothetical protein [Halobaculum sp. DT92]